MVEIKIKHLAMAICNLLLTKAAREMGVKVRQTSVSRDDGWSVVKVRYGKDRYIVKVEKAVRS